MTTAFCALAFLAAAAPGGARENRAFLRGDPYVQVGADLTASSMAASGLFGASGAISGDASTVLVGAPGDGSSGAAYVFVPSGAAWAQQAQLTDASLPASAYLGYSAALSTNGNTALVGAPNARVVLVFGRSGTAWTLRSTIDAPATITGFGTSVSLSGDGTTALIGDNGSTGPSNLTTALVYHLVGSAWVQQAVLTPSSEFSNGSTFFPASVALSSDGSTAIVGNAADGGGVGAVWMFVATGGVWSEQAGPVTLASGELGDGGFGGSTALSASGNTAAIGAPFDNCNDGAGYVFARSGGSWTQQSAKLTNVGLLGACGVGGPTFGYGAALSADGTSAFFGGGDSALFTATAGTWSEFQTAFTGGGETSLSSDGQTGLTTCAGCSAGAGIADVYHFVPGAALPGPVPAAVHIGGAPIATVRLARASARISLTYKVNVKASARIEVLRREDGVINTGVCVPPTGGVEGHICNRFVPVDTETVSARAGKNRYTLPSSAFPAAGVYELRLVLVRPGSRRNGAVTKTFTFKG